MAWSSMEGLRNSFRWRSETKKLITITIPRSPTGFGFSVAWSKPPEINFVNEGGEAAKRGLLQGDKLIYINKVKISKKDRDEITDIVKSINDEMELQVIRDLNSLKKRQASLRIKGQNPKKQTHVSAQDVNVISWKREKALLKLLQLEESFLNTLRCMKETYVLPLRRQPKLATSAELDILFSNILPLYSTNERFVLELREVTQRNEDMVGTLYRSQLGSRCQILETYLLNLPLAKIMLNYKNENKIFRSFFENCRKEEGDLEILPLLQKPLEYLESLLSNLEAVFSFTAVGHQDYVALENVLSKLNNFKEGVLEKMNKNLEEDEEELAMRSNFVLQEEISYPNLEDLQKQMIFPTGLKPFYLIHPGRYWLFAGQLLKVDGKYYVQHFAMLLSDALILTRKTREGILLVLEDPIMLKKIRRATFDVTRCTKEFFLEFEVEAKIRRYKDDSNSPKPTTTWTLRAPSFGLKVIWKTILEQQLQSSQVSSENEASSAAVINEAYHNEETDSPRQRLFSAENEVPYFGSVVVQAKALAKEASHSTSLQEVQKFGNIMQEMKPIQNPSANGDFQKTRSLSSDGDAEDILIRRSRSVDSPSCKIQTPQRTSLIVETTFMVRNKSAGMIPFIDSVEGASSGTESNIFGDDEGTSPARLVRDTSESETLVIEDVENERTQDVSNGGDLPRTQDKLVQTDVTCWMTMGGGNVQLPKKRFPRLGTLEKLHLSKSSKSPDVSQGLTKTKRFRLLSSSSFPVQSVAMDSLASGTNSKASSTKYESKIVCKDSKEKDAFADEDVGKILKAEPIDSEITEEPEKERFSWLMKRKKEVKTEKVTFPGVLVEEGENNNPKWTLATMEKYMRDQDEASLALGLMPRYPKNRGANDRQYRNTLKHQESKTSDQDTNLCENYNGDQLESAGEESSPSWASSSTGNTPSYSSGGTAFEFGHKTDDSDLPKNSPQTPIITTTTYTPTSTPVNDRSNKKIDGQQLDPQHQFYSNLKTDLLEALDPGDINDHKRESKGSLDRLKRKSRKGSADDIKDNSQLLGTPTKSTSRLSRLLRRTHSAGCSKETLAHNTSDARVKPPVTKTKSADAAPCSRDDDDVKRRNRKTLAQDMKMRLSFLRRRHTDSSLQASVRPSPEEAQKWGKSFNELTNSKYGLSLFRAFLSREFSEENIEFWLACEEFKRTRPNKLSSRARKIYDDFVAVQSPKEVNLDSIMRADILDHLQHPDRNSFDSAQRRIQGLMEQDAYLRFLQSDLYTDLLHCEQESTS